MKHKEIIIASRNQHKIEEIKRISKLKNIDCNFITYEDLDIPDIDETGNTFEANAIIKAKAVYEIYKKPVIADDSGLCVKALNGYPGIFSSRYSGGSSEDNISKLLIEMQGLEEEERKAFFNATVCYISDINSMFVFSGKIDGYIIEKRAGINGFGYDPVFYVKEYDKTMAELESDVKNSISHRFHAFNRLFDFLSKNNA